MAFISMYSLSCLYTQYILFFACIVIVTNDRAVQMIERIGGYKRNIKALYTLVLYELVELTIFTLFKQIILA